MRIRQIAIGSAWNGIALALRTLFLFLATLIATRYLQADGFGNISLAIAYTSIFTYLISLGFDRGLIYFAPQFIQSGNKDRLFSFFQKSIFLITGLGFFLTLLFYFLIPNFLSALGLENLQSVFEIFLVQSFLFAILVVAGACLKSVKSFLSPLLLEQVIFPLLLVLLAASFFYWQTARETLYAYAYLLATSISLSCMLWVLFRRKWESRIETPKTSSLNHELPGLQKLISYSAPLSLVSTLTSVAPYVSILIAGWYLTSSEIGIFSLSVRLAFFEHLFMLALIPFFSTRFSDYFARKDFSELQNSSQKITHWSASWGLAMWVVFLLCGKTLLSWFDQSFQTGHEVLITLGVGLFIASIFRPLSFLLMMTGHSRIVLIDSILNFGLAILLNYFLTSAYGLIGAAWATVSYLFIIGIFRVYIVYRKLGFWPLKTKFLIESGCILLSFLLLYGLYRHSYWFSANQDFMQIALSIGASFFVFIFLLRSDFGQIYRLILKNKTKGQSS